MIFRLKTICLQMKRPDKNRKKNINIKRDTKKYHMKQATILGNSLGLEYYIIKKQYTLG